MNGYDHLRPTYMGRALCSWFPIRRGVVMENLRHVFGGLLPPDGVRRLAECFYSHVWKSFLEMISLTWMSDRDIRRRVRVVGEQHLRRATVLNKGVLIFGGHFGNWEFAPIAAMLGVQEFRGRFIFVRKTLGPVLERIIFSRYYRSGLGVIPREGGLQQVLDALSRNDAVIFILDQHASPGSRKGIAVEFFGRPAGTNRSLAMIAIHTGAPVIPATCYREPDGSHVMEFRAPLETIRCDDPEREIYENTLQYNRVLERFVLEHPDQWFWFHRRWKLATDPAGARGRKS